MQHRITSRPLLFSLVLLLLLGSWNCSNPSASKSEKSPETATEDQRVDPEANPHLFVNVDNLRLRESYGTDAKVIAELPIGTRLANLGEASEETATVKLRGVTHIAPWVKVGTESGLTGWVFGGAVDTEESKKVANEGTFSSFLDNLEPGCDALATAQKSLKDRLANSNDEKDKDASIAAFYEFYRTTISKAEDMSSQQDKIADFNLLGYNPEKKPLPSHVTEQVEAWEACGVGIEFSEGDWYLAEHPDYMANNFAELSSPGMKAYLLQTQQELKKGFSEDAGLTISPLELAERMAFWDQFLIDHPGFIYQSGIQGKQKMRTGTLMSGLDNTPAFGHQNGELEPEWKSAYEWLMSEHKNSVSGKAIKEFYMMLKENGWKPTEKSHAYVKELSGW